MTSVPIHIWRRLNKKSIPYWNTYYPSIQDQSSDKKKFYKYFCTEIEKGNYIELGESLSYAFCYLYEIINDFIFTKDIELFEQKAQNLLNLYGHTKLESYLKSRRKDCYLFLRDYKKAREMEDPYTFGLPISKLLFYSKNGAFSTENGKIFLKTFGHSCLTKFGKENISGIEQALDVFLKDFKEENGMGLVDFFCQDFQKADITEDDIQKYRKFFKSDKQFQEYKQYDINRYYKDENISHYLRNKNITLFQSVRIEERNSQKHIHEDAVYIKGYGTVTIKTTLPTSLPEEYSILKTEVVGPGYVIGKALSNYAKTIIKEAENTYREESGIPKIGEGWISETELFYKIKKHFVDEVVVHHGAPERLGRQHLDIFFPEKNIGVEYQGKQHLEPVDYFGGEEAFKKQQQRDKKKAMKCKKNNCSLIYVYEDYVFDEVLKNISQLLEK